MKRLLIDLNSALRCVGKHKILYLVLIIQCILAFLLSLLLSQTFLTMNMKYDKYSNLYGNKSFYYVSYVDSSADKNSSDNQIYFNIARSINEINKSSDCKVVRLVNTNLDIEDKTLPLKFTYGYDRGDSEEPRTQDGHTYEALDYVGLSPEAFKEFDIGIESGRAFKDEEFNYKESGTIPVLLGSEYKDYFKIGDKFSALCYDEINCEVVGFLKKNSSYILNEKLTYLDRSVVLPAVNPSLSKPNESQLQMLSDQLMQSLILTNNKDFKQTQKYVTSCCMKANSTTLLGISSVNPSDWFPLIKSTKDNLTLTLILTAALIIFAIISLSLALLGIIRQNYYEYGIHLTCGATLKSIFFQIAVYTASILIISLIISTNLLKKRLFNLSSDAVNITIGIAVLIFIISVIPSFFAVKKLNVSQLIRGKE